MNYRRDTDTEDRVPTTWQRTSIESAKAFGKDKKNELRFKVHSEILNRGGLTCAELEEILNRTHQAVSCTIRFLVEDGFLEDSGEERINPKTNRKNIIWKAKTKTRPAAVQMDLIADPLKAGI